MDEIIVTAKIRQNERDAKPYLCGVVEINDRLLVNYEHGDLSVDLTELAKTLDTDGEFFIITCSCGDAGCAGINEGVQVTREHNVLRWLVRKSGKGPEPERAFTFNAEAYTAAVKRGLVQFMQLYEDNPTLETTPYLLRDRIEFARQQNWLSRWLAA
jgi:hypothetical protein